MCCKDIGESNQTEGIDTTLVSLNLLAVWIRMPGSGGASLADDASRCH